MALFSNNDGMPSALLSVEVIGGCIALIAAGVVVYAGGVVNRPAVVPSSPGTGASGSTPVPLNGATVPITLGVFVVPNVVLSGSPAVIKVHATPGALCMVDIIHPSEVAPGHAARQDEQARVVDASGQLSWQWRPKPGMAGPASVGAVCRMGTAAILNGSNFTIR